MLPKHVRYQTALHPVVPVSLACPAGDFLSIHPFQQFVNPQNEFFCGFFDSFWAFFGKSPQMPVFSAFFRFPLPVIRGVFGSYPPAKPSARPCRSAKRRFRTWTKPSPSAALPGALHAPPPDDHPADCRRVPALQIRHPQRHAPAPSAGGCSPRPRSVGAAGLQQVRPPFARRRGNTAALRAGKKPKICGVLAIS